eukprot:TRINITY_DN1975_c0_g1_i1.p1 TRINITY_DN1975_c0_g1~~TRINITY_DN1975_c0_g1_i1.p1  ORF type:complete len:242 (-),score=39.68 TRINITY_DN1975_c0_g1_i1:16-741(-)
MNENLIVENVEFYACKNSHNKYLIPTRDNFFGGIQIPHVLCDTGCSSTLLVLQEEDLVLMMNTFSSTSYLWSVRGSRGILHPITLSILPKGDKRGTMIDCKLGPWSISLPRLRFYLCYDDVMILKEVEFLSPESLTCIDNWLEQVDALKELFPDKSMAERRKMALLGQSVLNDFDCHQMSDLFFATSKEFHSFDTLPQLIEQMTEKVTYYLPELFPEFDELHDEEDFYLSSTSLPEWCLDE